jgi:hypothetical protein
MARKNTKKRMQPQPQQQLPQQQPSSEQLPPQQQQPVPTWSPKHQQDQQQQQQAAEPDLFGDEFFSKAPASHAPAALDMRWDDAEDVPKIAPDKRRAMLATIVIFSVLATAVGGFVIYTQVIMPTPVTLGASSGILTVPQAMPYAPEPALIATPAPAAAEVIAAAEPVAAEQVAVEEPVVVTTVAIAAPVAPRAARRERPIVRAAAPSPVDQSSLSAQAMRMLNTGHAADARRLAQQAVQSNPERAEGWIVLGAANASLGDAEAARTAYANCTARASGPRVATCRALAR